jgi:hypothetical protein
MIEAAISFSGARLAERAATLAEVHAETVVRTRKTDAGRWCMPHLLWPLFTRKS